MAARDKDHIDCSISDTDLFTPAFMQTDIEGGTYEEIYPVTKLEENGPVEFVIKNASDMFIDLVNSYLRVKVKLLKNDGNVLAGTDKAASFVNYPIASIFNQLDLYLGGTLITSSSNTYAFRSIIEVLLNYGEDAKRSQLSMGLFQKDSAGHMEETDPTKENKGLFERHTHLKNSQTVELSGKLHTDLCNQGRLIVNGLPLRIVLHRNKDSFSIMSAENNCKIKLVEAIFSVHKVQLTPHKFAEIQQELEKRVISYPINRVAIKTHSVASGLTSLNWDNVILGQLPNRLFIGMVDNDSFTGSYKKNPFNFKHFDVREISVYVNGKTLSAPMRLNFQENEYLEAYRSLFTTTGKINRDEGLFLDRKEYPLGNSLFGFDLSPTLCNGPHQEPIKEGNLRISLEFSKALPNTITVLLYADFDNTIQINKVRGVLKDY